MWHFHWFYSKTQPYQGSDTNYMCVICNSNIVDTCTLSVSVNSDMIPSCSSSSQICSGEVIHTSTKPTLSCQMSTEITEGSEINNLNGSCKRIPNM